MIEISVNLATYNRASFLEACLVSLCEQSIDPSRYEICVVNNACTDYTPEIVARVATRYPAHHLFMVHEAQPGLSRARNCGLRHTTGPLIANVDDDGSVNGDWLALFLKHFAEQGDSLAVVGGEIEPIWGAPKPDWMTPMMQSFLSAGTGLGPVARFLTEDERASEGNSCYRRAALDAAGNYPTGLGRVGKNLLSGESAVEATIRHNGGRVFFDPAIILKHHIHADRLTPIWFRRRYFWQGVSGFAIRDYQRRHGYPVDAEAFLNLPLETSDWAFLAGDTAEGLHKSLHHFQSLGFILALTGIIPIESA